MILHDFWKISSSDYDRTRYCTTTSMIDRVCFAFCYSNTNNKFNSTILYHIEMNHHKSCQTESNTHHSTSNIHQGYSPIRWPHFQRKFHWIPQFGTTNIHNDNNNHKAIERFDWWKLIVVVIIIVTLGCNESIVDFSHEYELVAEMVDIDFQVFDLLASIIDNVICAMYFLILVMFNPSYITIYFCLAIFNCDDSRTYSDAML